METSENTATPSPAPTADTRRRSGRERRVPEKFQPEVTITPKRKRGDEDDVENQNPDEEVEEDDDMPSEDEASSDDEGERATRSKRKKSTASRPPRAKRPAAKKPKINGTAPASAPSITVGLPSRPKPKKTARVITGDARDGDGVYGKYTPLIRVELCADAKQPTYLGLVTPKTMLRAGGTRNTNPTTKRP